jgi:CRISPR-associated protein Csb1
MEDQLTLNDLKEAVRAAAAFRSRTKLRPIGEDGDKVFPPTYAGGVYAVEDRRIDGRVVRCVLLDSVQSQANRMEDVLQEAFLPNWRELPRDGEDPSCDLPVLAVYVDNHGWVTSLTAPHRIHDAILRDSEIEEEKSGQKRRVRFRDSEVGQVIVAARPHNATPFYRYCPTALLFGTWDSTAGEGSDSAKVPRAVVSEIIGVDITAGVRTASRIDPLGIKAQSATIYRRTDRGWAFQDSDGGWVGAQLEDLEKDKDGNPKKFGKGKPSDINHGNHPPHMPRFEDTEIRQQNLNRLADILESSPLKLRFDLDSADGRLESHTALDSERVRIRAGAIKPGGVTMAYALHTWTLSLTQLRRLRFPVSGEFNENRNNAARTVLAALAIYALALQHAHGCWLRSRCDLVPIAAAENGAAVLEQINADGTAADFAFPSVQTAKQLLAGALGGAESGAEAEIGWEKRVIRLTPTEQLRRLVELSDGRQPEEADEEPVVADDAGDQG